MQKEPTCFKNHNSPSRIIYLFLTNRPRCFQNTVTKETDIPDFHRIVVPVLTVFYKKQKPNIIHYWSHKNFSNDMFRLELNDKFRKLTLTMLNNQNSSIVNSVRKISEKLTFLSPIYKRTCAYRGGGNVSFSDNFAYVRNEGSPRQ